MDAQSTAGYLLRGALVNDCIVHAISSGVIVVIMKIGNDEHVSHRSIVISVQLPPAEDGARGAELFDEFAAFLNRIELLDCGLKCLFGRVVSQQDASQRRIALIQI